MRRILIALCALGLITSCSSKKKVDDPGSAGDSISTKDLAYDAVGSDSGKIAGLHSIHFGYDETRLSSEARKTLAENVAWMKANSSVSMQVEGHCDQRGSIEYNLSLGERRAKAVKTYMVSIGADASKLTTLSYGKEKLLDSGDSDSAMARNRRANFVPLGK